MVSRLKKFRKCIKEHGLPSESIVTKTSNSSFYDRLNFQWNLRVPHIDPLAYFLPKCTSDVQVAVRCARTSNIRVIPKSGGHSYESLCFGTSDTIIIDFKKMSRIRVNSVKKTLTVQPRALIGTVNYKLWKSGGYGLPLGNCLTVGIAGTTLGGGYGYYSHTYGLTIDNLLELKMVAANGTVHIVNKAQHPDLFWALRGVGSGYIGIVTKLKFKLFQASDTQMRHLSLSYQLKDSADVLESWQRWLEWTRKNAPTVICEMYFSGQSIGEFSQASGAEIDLSIMMVQNKSSPHFQQDDTFIKHAIEIFPKSNNTIVKSYSYMEYMLKVGYTPVMNNRKFKMKDLPTLDQEISKPRYVKQKAFYVNRYFKRSTLENVAQVLKRIPNRYVWVDLETAGGAIRNVPPNSTAYVHRNALYSFLVRYEGSDNATEVKAGWAWIEEFMEATKPFDNGETYQNFVDRDMKDHFQRYYGENLPRLIKTKRHWDPTNYFQNPESLPVQ